ncbi:MAG: methylated-DNA--[protein]-cysteine S-methyltransferase [Xanthomonadales bacterium]|jgi:AraC family transcriptional regulator of adaptative response/methylated-DNA-[protein]-cysteine methyltransferase|nr:methylated-DNA--[protein]-cysteine S-methyltransferase [Xanthomonadales bacterium]
MTGNTHYELVARALDWIAQNRLEQPELSELARELGVSPHHLQRVFQEWAGVSPKQFLKSLTRQAALERLASGESVLDAAISSGLSGPGRLHDLLVTTEALTPGEIKKRGQGVKLCYGFGACPFGEALVSWSGRGINFLGFCGEKSREQVLDELISRLSNADFRGDPEGAQKWLDTIFESAGTQPVSLWLRGSPFQLKVWEALLAIPEGANATYGQIAKRVGSPGASRAVGRAVGSNPVSWIIPCHRVIRQLGELGGYRWGTTTKSAMIGLEASRIST